MAEWLQSLPIWLLGVLIFAATVACSALGAGLDRWYAGHFPNQRKLTAAQAGYVVTTVYALLGLLTGFTFQLAVERFELRRQLVLQDANAIQTLYLKAQLLEDPHRSKLSSLLIRFTQNQIELAEARREDSHARTLLANDDRFLRDLWTTTIAAFESVKTLDFSSSFIESANEVTNIDSTRRAARLPPIPATIIAVLIFYSLVAAAVLGAIMKSRKGEITSVVLLGLSTLALMLITDINRPVDGTIHESQEPMRQMLHFLQSSPAGVSQGVARN